MNRPHIFRHRIEAIRRVRKSNREQEAGEHSENQTFRGIHNAPSFAELPSISTALTTGFSAGVPEIRYACWFSGKRSEKGIATRLKEIHFRPR